MHLDPSVALAGLIVGFTVGLTGMGGGALMTPILVLLFNVQPLAAVSSDLVNSLLMKPVGGGVHLRRGTVQWSLVRWLVIGSVPSAFVGVLILRQLGEGSRVQNSLKALLGWALLVAAMSMVAKAVLQAREHRRMAALGRSANEHPYQLKPIPTLFIGVAGGLIVGMTSVGSGSLMIVMLMLLYPSLSARSLVGTDLVQAVPLVMSAALGHVFFGDLQLDITGALLVGSVPGAYIGAQLSSRLPGALIRRALAFVLLASSLKLFNVDTTLTLIILGVLAAIAGPIWMVLRRMHGFPALPKHERLQADAAETEVAADA